jgi:transcriptional regulator with XRE-family HTH domain
MSIGEKVKMLMEQKGWSQADLVKQSGVSKSTLSDILCGKTSPGAKHLVSISTALGVSTDYLVSEGAQPVVEHPTPIKIDSVVKPSYKHFPIRIETKLHYLAKEAAWQERESLHEWILMAIREKVARS